MKSIACICWLISLLLLQRPSADGEPESNATQVQPSPQAPPATLPVTDTPAVVNEVAFNKAVNERPNVFENWKGTASLGISLVQATQTSQSYTSSVNFVRLLPMEDWLEPANRTTLSFNSSYGNLSEPGTPSVRLRYFTPAPNGMNTLRRQPTSLQMLVLIMIFRKD